MKKFLLAVAAFGMLLTSCSNDDTVQGDNSSAVKFVVSTPEMKTRADIGDVYGTGFAAEDLEYAIYECDAEGNLKDNVPNISKEVAGAFAGNALETSFTERLVNGKHYVILFWADATEDPYKVDWANQSISIENPAALKAQNENLDAFFAKIQFTVTNNMLEQTVELKRPFAQLNVGVSDTAAAATAGLEVEKTQVKVKAYTALNLFDGTVSGQQELTYAMENIPADVTFTDPDGVVYDIISMNYLLVNEKELNDVTFTYTDKGDAQAIPERTFSLVPVQRNHRTFVVGDLLTTAVNVKVIILPGFDNDYIYPTSIALALTEGGLFKLQDNTTLDKNYTLSKATTIDLNGYNLTYTGSDAIMIRVADGGSLTITGDGNVDAGESYIASANAGGIITVEGGNFTTTGPTLFQANGGKVYISGGYFDNDSANYGTTYMLNHVDSKKNEGLIEVTGGQFVGYNPAASKSENPVMSFVPEGYAASITGTNADGESIYKVQKAVPMTGLTAAPAQVYQAATLSWDAVAGAKKYVVKYNGVQVGETTTTTVTTAEGGVADAAVAKFTVEAFDENGGMLGYGETPETKVFTLLNRPEPAVYLANGQLIVENKELNPGEAVKSNFDLNAILLEAEVYFYKDGEAAPAYTAVGSYKETYPTANLPLSISEKKIKNNVAGSYNTWKWNGGAATATAPDFEPGTYTVKYKAGYYPVMNAKFDRTPTDRIIYGAESDVLATMIYREGEASSFSIASVAPTAVAEGYQGAKVTWAAIQGATSYKVFVDGKEKATTETTEAVVTGLTDKAAYKFTVKAYDANGAVIATGESKEETKIFTLINRPEPAVYFANGQLIVENKELNPGEAVKSNFDLNAILLEAEVYFYKNGETTPTYTAVGSYQETYPAANLPLSISEKKIKNNVAGSYNTWKWNGATEATKTVPVFDAGEYTIKYKAGYYPVMNAKFDRNPTDRIIYGAESDVLATMIYREGEVAEKHTAGMVVEANALVDEVILSWNSAGANATYEVYADGNKVGETTEITYACPATLGDHNYEVKVAGTTVSSAVSAKVEYSIAHWTAPTFEWTGKRMKVSGLADISEVGGAGYAYGGAITNDNDTSKSTIEIYNEAGTLLYTLTNGTGQGTLTAWAGYGRWALNAQDNRQDWTWVDANGNCISKKADGGTEGDVAASYMPAGKYTLKWTIGYVVNKNSNWATTNNDSAIVGSREDGATCIYFGPKDTKPSPNVCYTDSSKTAVKIITKSGEATLVIE